MQFEEILTRNRAFVAGRAVAPLPGVATLPLAVVACYDPRLDFLVREALGLVPTESFLFRVAGALLRPDSNSLRSLANSVYFFGVSEVMVVGHSSCRMATFSTTEYINAFRKRGVPRDAFGVGDLRDWAGAIPSPRAGVLRSLEAMAAAPYLPRDLLASGVLLDDASGALEVVSPPVALSERTGAVAAGRSERSGMVTSDITSGATAPPMAAEVQATAAGAAETEAAASEPETAGVPSREIEEMREFVRLLESTSGWKEELLRVRDEIGRQRNPIQKLQILEKFFRRATVNARDLAGSFDRLKAEAAAGRAKGFDLDQLVALFLKAGGRPRR